MTPVVTKSVTKIGQILAPTGIGFWLLFLTICHRLSPDLSLTVFALCVIDCHKLSIDMRYMSHKINALLCGDFGFVTKSRA